MDSLAVLIPSQTASLGRVSFGPEFAYRVAGANGAIYEPHLALKGMWDFDKSDATTIGGLIVGSDDFRAKAEAGMLARWPNGYSFRIVGTYDGIGSNSLHAVGTQIWLNVPFR